MHKPKFEFFLVSFPNLLAGNFVPALFLSLAFLFVSSFLAHLIVFLSNGIVAG